MTRTDAPAMGRPVAASVSVPSSSAACAPGGAMTSAATHKNATATTPNDLEKIRVKACELNMISLEFCQDKTVRLHRIICRSKPEYRLKRMARNPPGELSRVGLGAPRAMRILEVISSGPAAEVARGR